MTTNEKIEKYKEAFYAYNGKYPHIQKRGSWIYINRSSNAVRVSDLVRRTKYLKEMERNKYIETQNNNSYDRDYFTTDLLKDKPCEKCYYLRRELYLIKENNKRIEKEKRYLNQEKNKLLLIIRDLQDKIVELRKNSVLFSMDDLNAEIQETKIKNIRDFVKDMDISF